MSRARAPGGMCGERERGDEVVVEFAAVTAAMSLPAVGIVHSRRVRRWRVEHRADGTWAVTNQTGSPALDVCVSLHGRHSSDADVAAAGRVDSGDELTFTLGPDTLAADPEAHMLSVAWTLGFGSPRQRWSGRVKRASA